MQPTAWPKWGLDFNPSHSLVLGATKDQEALLPSIGAQVNGLTG